MATNRARKAPKPAYLVPDLGSKQAPRGFFNTLLVKVETFEGLRRSGESLDLRFFHRGELPGLDVIETARPIIERYLRPEPAGSIMME